VGNRETFEDWDSMGNTITGVYDTASGSSCGIEGHDSLNGDIAVGDLEGVKHDLDHLFSVGFGVSWSLGEEYTTALRWVDSQFVVESVIPHLLHIIPGFDNTSSDWIFKIKDTSLLVSFFSNVTFLLSNTLHHACILGTSDDGRENAYRSLFSSETGLDHS